MANTEFDAWRAAARTYQRHVSGCAECVAAGLQVSGAPRCSTGAQLWRDYESQLLPAMLHSSAELAKKSMQTVAQPVARRGGRLDAWEYM